MKLIRDKIAQSINESGEAERLYREYDPAFAMMFLLEKVQEEAEEVATAETRDNLIEEIGDLMDVLDEVMVRKDISPEELQSVRDRKAEKRGLFKDNFILIKERQ